jgi:hypothetical protein
LPAETNPGAAAPDNLTVSFGQADSTMDAPPTTQQSAPLHSTPDNRSSRLPAKAATAPEGVALPVPLGQADKTTEAPASPQQSARLPSVPDKRSSHSPTKAGAASQGVDIPLVQAGHVTQASSRLGVTGHPTASDNGSSHAPALAPSTGDPKDVALPLGQSAVPTTGSRTAEQWGTVNGGWPEIVIPFIMLIVGVTAAGLAILRAAESAGRGAGRGWLPCVFRASHVYQPSACEALLGGDEKRGSAVLGGDGQRVSAGQTSAETPGEST